MPETSACQQVDSTGEKAFGALMAQAREMPLEEILSTESKAPPTASSPEPSEVAAPPGKPLSLPDGLTVREGEVLRLATAGLTDAQIAQRLVISPRTVNTHLISIYSKIGVTSRSIATRYAIEHHLL
jgi:DNA-binding NarL/FixJ family response regulator